jgi:hypothetical protein
MQAATRTKPKHKSSHADGRRHRRVITGSMAAEIFRRADAFLDDEDRRRFVADIEEARRLMNNERLH